MIRKRPGIKSQGAPAPVVLVALAHDLAVGHPQDGDAAVALGDVHLDFLASVD